LLELTGLARIVNVRADLARTTAEVV